MLPLSATYTLANNANGFAEGTITVTVDSDVNSATDILPFWADDNGKLEGYKSLFAFEITGTTTVFLIDSSVIIPKTATRLLLYAHDTGLFLEETWEYLKNLDVKFDLVTLDCTAGAKMDYHYPMHMCLGWNIKCRDDLIKYGLADEKTKFVANHFSHNGLNTVYDDFKVIAEKYGFIASYDGLEIEV